MTRNFLFSRLASPIGRLDLVTEAERLAALDFEGYEARRDRLLARYFGRARRLDGPAPPALANALNAYFEGQLDALDALETVEAGSEFQKSVWAALRTIKPGETLSYGGLAARIGKPGASRAVGLANGSNPLALVVPCHRVIGANGTLTGYGGGVGRKAWLLRHEGAVFL